MKYVKWVLVLLYIYFILTQTIIGRSTQAESIFQGLFWEIRSGMWSDILMNILLFIPLGFLVEDWKGGIVMGFALSVGIELTQYVFHLGYCELDDVLNNTIGSAFGVGLNVMIRKSIVDMGLRKWDTLPEFMKTPDIRPYWEILWRRRGQLVIKRCFDLVVALILFVVLAIPMAIIAILIKAEDGGDVLYRQERVTSYGKRFKIHKFRTMVSNADKIGTSLTTKDDARITSVGLKLRRLRLDELPQIFDVIEGNMSFVGTRPEAVKYVERYKSEWNATLLLPAGITSECSIRYKDEDKFLDGVEDVDTVYIEQVLPGKMKWNLESVEKFSFGSDVKTMFRTVAAVLGKDYE